MVRIKIMPYLKALKLIFVGTKHPMSTLFTLALKLPPYHIILSSGKEVEVTDRFSVLEEIMELKMGKNIPSHFAWNFNETEYRITGFNSSATIFSTFIYEDWKKLSVKGKFVLDIGGYIGDTAIYFIAKGAKKVVVYEAFPYSYKIALTNIKQNKLDDRIEINNSALGGLDSHMTIDPNYVNDNGSRAISQDTGIKVPVTSLGTIVEKYSIDGWSLKMNCEGCEYDVFQNTSADVFQKFSEIYMHYHGSPDPLIQKLRQAGFKVKCGEYIHAIKK
ncbi:MAG: FkbM family methyltransferase [Candidatus Thermoplasmatota archaeon]|nr:FkbM family methyltransferase [Candidatus Thermoplasmatota archaeon]